MAQRTIAAGGGNFSLTTTWVEGIVPTSSDHIVGDASSGQLTVNGNYTVQYMNLSAYTNTITFNAGNTLTLGLASSTTTISSGTTYAGTGILSLGTVAMTISSSTTSRIPNLTINSATKTLTNNLYATTILITGLVTISGSGYKLFANGNLTSQAGLTLGTGVDLVLDGTGNVDFAGGFNGTGRVVINTSGTITTSGANGFYLNDNGNLVYSGGTMVTPFITVLSQTVGSSFNFYVSGITWDYINYFNVANSSTIDFNLYQDLNCQIFNISLDRGNNTEQLRFQQTGKLNVIDKMTLQSNTATAAGVMRLNTTATHSINKLFALSSSINKFTIRSTTNGTKATLNLGDKSNSPIFFTNFTDINANGGQNIRTYDATVSNCDNITSYTGTIFTTGGGTFAYIT